MLHGWLAAVSEAPSRPPLFPEKNGTFVRPPEPWLFIGCVRARRSPRSSTTSMPALWSMSGMGTQRCMGTDFGRFSTTRSTSSHLPQIFCCRRREPLNSPPLQPYVLQTPKGGGIPARPPCQSDVRVNGGMPASRRRRGQSPSLSIIRAAAAAAGLLASRLGSSARLSRRGAKQYIL
jgi:hypothetical protein